MTEALDTIEDEAGLRRVMEEAKTVAVIGMKPRGEGPANSVPRYLETQGYAIIPVNPKYDEIDGAKSHPTVVDIAQPVDMVVIFRRPHFILGHADEILEMDPLPRTVWMQLGIRNDRAARRLIEAGVDVVQDRCLAIEHPRLTTRAQ